MATTQGAGFLSTPGRLIAWAVGWYAALLLVLRFIGDRTSTEFVGLAVVFAICFAVGTWRAIRRLPTAAVDVPPASGPLPDSR